MNKSTKIFLGVLLLAAAVCCVILLLPRGGGTIARVTLDGAVVAEIDLSRTDADSFTVTGPAGTNTIQVEQGRIRVSSADCPDQVCVDQGWISDGALPIVCLPNKLVIEIVGGEGELDGVVK